MSSHVIPAAALLIIKTDTFYSEYSTTITELLIPKCSLIVTVNQSIMTFY